MIEFSLIVPTYNRAEDLSRLLKNLDLQTKPPTELILVDASDSTATEVMVNEAASRFSYPIRYFHHSKGLTRQRNFGITQARYPVIGFSDDDCVFEPTFLERILDVFERNGSATVGGVSGLVFEVDPSNIASIDGFLASEPTGTAFTEHMQRFVYRGAEGWKKRLRNRLERIVFMETPIPGTFSPRRCRFFGLELPFEGERNVDFLRGVAFYRREVFDHVQYSPFFEGYGFGEDVHFSLQVAKRWVLQGVGDAFGFHLHAPAGRPNLFRVGMMSTRNFAYIFKSYQQRTFRDRAVFWYFFAVNALLDLVFLLPRNPKSALRMFGGRLYGVVLLVKGSIRSDPIDTSS